MDQTIHRHGAGLQFLTILWCGLFLVTVLNTAQAETPQQIAKKAFRSTVLLVMEDANGQPMSLGSGFFVEGGRIATNLHVVEGASRGYAKVIGQKAKYDIEGISAIDPYRDLILLKISAPQIAALPLGNSDAVEVGEQVYAVGNPQGLEGTFSQGIVSSVRQVGSDKLLQITAPISPGSSGGPVLNAQCEVIGVSVATFSGGQNLNFAIPSNYLSALRAKVGKVKPLVNAKSPKKSRSIVADLGGRSTEGVVGSHMTWKYKSNIGTYSFSLRNKLRRNVTYVYCLVVFYDSRKIPIDVNVVQYQGVIPAGLAKRVIGYVDGSVQELTTTFELRILDFRLAQ